MTATTPQADQPGEDADFWLTAAWKLSGSGMSKRRFAEAYRAKLAGLPEPQPAQDSASPDREKVRTILKRLAAEAARRAPAEPDFTAIGIPLGWCREAEAALAALASLPAPQRQEPAPAEPTVAILKAGDEAYVKCAGGHHYAGLDGMTCAYRAMLAATFPPKEPASAPAEGVGEALHEAAGVLTDVAPILDVVKGEWAEAWTEHDQSVRDRVTKALASFYALSPKQADRDLAAALSASSVPPAGVAVKPLEWVQGDGKSRSADSFEAPSVFGTYIVEDGSFWIKESNGFIGDHATDADAKGAAQADYESRIRSCLASPPADTAAIIERCAEVAKARAAELRALVEADPEGEISARLDAAAHNCEIVEARIRALSPSSAPKGTDLTGREET